MCLIYYISLYSVTYVIEYVNIGFLSVHFPRSDPCRFTWKRTCLNFHPAAFTEAATSCLRLEAAEETQCLHIWAPPPFISVVTLGVHPFRTGNCQTIVNVFTVSLYWQEFTEVSVGKADQILPLSPWIQRGQKSILVVHTSWLLLTSRHNVERCFFTQLCCWCQMWLLFQTRVFSCGFVMAADCLLMSEVVKNSWKQNSLLNKKQSLGIALRGANLLTLKGIMIV